MVEGLTSFSTDQGSEADPGSHENARRNRSLQSAPREDHVLGAGRCRSTIHAENPGDTGGEATPVPIPNTEVKLSSAEDTERAAFRENRSSPGSCAFRRSSSASRSPDPARDATLGRNERLCCRG